MRRSIREVDINPIDRHVGERLRQMRLERGLDCRTLADALGISVAVLIAHEGGALRIGAERLFVTCQLLDVPVSRFYAHLEL